MGERLDTVKHRSLADHVVGEVTVFPGAGFAEFALAAASHWHGGGYAEIEDLEIRAPLLLAKEPSQIVRCALDPRDGQLSIKSREQLKQEQWTVHAVGRILREPTDIRLGKTLGELPTRLPDFTGHSHNLLTVAAGLSYGPKFRAIEYGWIEAGTALAVLSRPCPCAPSSRTTICTRRARLHIPVDHPAAARRGRGLRGGDLCADADRPLELLPGHDDSALCPRPVAQPRTARNLGGVRDFRREQQPIAVLEQVRFRSIALHRDTAEPIRNLEYRAVPRPLTQAARAFRAFPSTVSPRAAPMLRR